MSTCGFGSFCRLLCLLGFAALAPVVLASPAAAQSPAIASRWSGTYYYPDGSASVPFEMQLDVRGATFSGRTREPATFGDGSSSELYANIYGSVSGNRVSFTKTYDGTGGVSHSVYYEGRLSADGTRMEGTWEIEWSGRFDAVALDPPPKPAVGPVCDECGRALVREVETGLGFSQMLPSYVLQALINYGNCADRAVDQCRSNCWYYSLAEALPRCDHFDDAGYRACVDQTARGVRISCE